MTLCGNLGAHENINLPALHTLHNGANILARLRGIRGEHLHPRIGESPCGFLRDALHTRSYPDKGVRLTAMGAALGLRHGEAGHMTDQASGIAMLHKPAIGFRALHFFPARLADHQRGKAAPIEIEQDLFAPRQGFRCGLHQRC